MTLNAVIALILRFFSPNSIALLANYVRKVLSPSSSLPLLAKLTHPAARSLYDGRATCLFMYMYVAYCDII